MTDSKEIEGKLYRATYGAQKNVILIKEIKFGKK